MHALPCTGAGDAGEGERESGHSDSASERR